VVNNLSNGKATGPDDIPAEIYQIKMKSEKIVAALAKEYNEFFANETILPSSWNKTKMKFLHKNGDKHDYTLMQVFLKIYAKILNNRLLGKNEYFNENSNGFRKHRVIAQKLIAIYETISEAERKQTPLHMLAIDFQKAFDLCEK
jgi:hypothetical protein